MLLPFAVKAANAMLVSSKLSHDLAVDASVHTIQYLARHPEVPDVVQHFVVDSMSTALLWGDAFGNLMVQFYIFLLNL
jgi:hypothetical protein